MNLVVGSLETDDPRATQRPSSVHPLADLFPMLEGDDLAALAEDIRVNGLLHPILVDADDQLIDGRNRLAACRIAGVEPRFERIDGDAEAIIWSANVQRRQMSKGAIAMVGAMSAPKMVNSNHPAARGIRAAERRVGVNHATMSKAFIVRDHAPDLAPQVIAGGVTLDWAFEQASARKLAAEWRDDGLAKLRKVRPDLADRVVAEEISVDEGYAIVADDAKREKALRESVALAMQQMVIGSVGVAHFSRLAEFPKWVSEPGGERLIEHWLGLDPERMTQQLDDTERGVAAAREVLREVVKLRKPRKRRA